VGCVAPCSGQPANTSRGQTPLLSLRLGTPGAPMSAALNGAAGVSSASEPCPIGRVLLDEVARECAVPASAAPDLHSAAGKFRRAVLCIFEEFEAAMLRAIEPQDDALADFKRLVLMSELTRRSRSCKYGVVTLLIAFQAASEGST
jgi:hypothetical protein